MRGNNEKANLSCGLFQQEVGVMDEIKDKGLCPINSHPQSDGMCQKEKCALWTSERWGCVFQLIAYELSNIHNDLEDRSR